MAAYNVFNAEQVHGVFGGASEAGAPILVQISPAARSYMGQKFFEGMIAAAENVYGSVEYSVHLDHGNTDHCRSAIHSGFYNSVMIDASHENYERNIFITSEIVKRAHDNGVAVEAELGLLEGVEDDMSVSSDKARHTDPEQAAEFVARTKCDSLAVAVGTSHGAYKHKSGNGLDLDALQRIQTLLPRYPLVLHGASGVPFEETARINVAGGSLQPDAKGISTADLLKAIRYGVTKINIATDMRLIWARVHREFFRNSPELFDPVVPGRTYIEELRKFVKMKCQSLNLTRHED